MLFEFVFVFLLWGGGVEPRVILDTETEVANLPTLPAAWEGERIGLIADLQIGMWLGNSGMIEEAVKKLVEERPAAVLIAGDFIYKRGEDPSDEIARVIELVRPLGEAGIPTFAVLGNHDYSLFEKDDPKDRQQAMMLVRGLEDAGVRVLRNEAVAVIHPDRRDRAPVLAVQPAPAAALMPPLYIVGLGSLYADNDKPILALQQVPPGAGRIVFMHHPNSFKEIPAWNAPVAMAGHRHGGQFAIPFLGSWLQLIGIHGHGWTDKYFGQLGDRLYINRGIGMSLVPIRINAPPEVTFFTLRRAGQ